MIYGPVTSEDAILHWVRALLRTVVNVWPSLLHVVGANKKAIFLKDIDTARSIHILDTQSDVFTVEQQEVHFIQRYTMEYIDVSDSI